MARWCGMSALNRHRSSCRRSRGPVGLGARRRVKSASQAPRNGSDGDLARSAGPIRVRVEVRWLRLGFGPPPGVRRVDRSGTRCLRPTTGLPAVLADLEAAEPRTRADQGAAVRALRLGQRPTLEQVAGPGLCDTLSRSKIPGAPAVVRLRGGFDAPICPALPGGRGLADERRSRRPTARPPKTPGAVLAACGAPDRFASERVGPDGGRLRPRVGPGPPDSPGPRHRRRPGRRPRPTRRPN
jgi:hypothetical protein